MCELANRMCDLLSPYATWFVVLVLGWTLPWKGVALWRAARNKQMWWFVAMFVLNTLAILEIVYIFRFSKRKRK